MGQGGFVRGAPPRPFLDMRDPPLKLAVSRDEEGAPGRPAPATEPGGPMNDDTTKKDDETKEEADKTPQINDLEPEKNPAGGTDHDLPPGQKKKTGGGGGG